MEVEAEKKAPQPPQVTNITMQPMNFNMPTNTNQSDAYNAKNKGKDPQHKGLADFNNKDKIKDKKPREEIKKSPETPKEEVKPKEEAKPSLTDQFKNFFGSKTDPTPEKPKEKEIVKNYFAPSPTQS